MENLMFSGNPQLFHQYVISHIKIDENSIDIGQLKQEITKILEKFDYDDENYDESYKEFRDIFENYLIGLLNLPDL